ncbi:hypothetical protein F2Q70_00036297 [Brassica cretica]|uniref:Uncharacterized protein n=1 Tax=Brassica cretica TaxID=69181 RepID=A0A8S9JPD0_BRACR|nr:hypothetical protein F2Q70_00036297 [Brassica cretica]
MKQLRLIWLACSKTRTSVPFMPGGLRSCLRIFSLPGESGVKGVKGKKNDSSITFLSDLPGPGLKPIKQTLGAPRFISILGAVCIASFFSAVAIVYLLSPLRPGSNLPPSIFPVRL